MEGGGDSLIGDSEGDTPGEDTVGLLDKPGEHVWVGGEGVGGGLREVEGEGIWTDVMKRNEQGVKGVDMEGGVSLRWRRVDRRRGEEGGEAAPM